MYERSKHEFKQIEFLQKVGLKTQENFVNLNFQDCSCRVMHFDLQALHFLMVAKDAQQFSTIACNATITACANGHEWQVGQLHKNFVRWFLVTLNGWKSITIGFGNWPFCVFGSRCVHFLEPFDIQLAAVTALILQVPLQLLELSPEKTLLTYSSAISVLRRVLIRKPRDSPVGLTQWFNDWLTMVMLALVIFGEIQFSHDQKWRLGSLTGLR